jgi:hypothetical protein
VIIERLDEEYEPSLIAALKACREDPRIGRNALGSIIAALDVIKDKAGPRLTGWPEGMDDAVRPRWGNEEAAWLKAKALNDAHHEEQRVKKNAI